ncbi:flagellar biosynthesis protein FlhB [Bacillus sp. 1NLA3E]|uniref:flagellar biosynthesis protein FlhB n=1 Tax=Bacillus sp. 1NLA3E TaxID=666686 RepID=UPI000247F315|nr:flagellar biosynthesis protein FlhB [Bacillus sp. 1NLA3E]AGK55360.1 flagellar biosynthesis protein FlhB [Bacillus sp. 1NLA3E]
MAEEKTEKATPFKRREARKKGQVAKSPEVASAVTLLLGFAFFMIGGKIFVEGCLNIFRVSFQEYMQWDLSYSSLSLIFKQLLWNGGKLLAPLFGIIILAGVVANFAQVGFMINAEGAKMNFGKINPLEGAKNIFSLRALMELLKSVLKIVIISFVVFSIIWGQRTELFALGTKTIWDTSRFVGSLVIKVGIAASSCLMILAAADYAFRRYEHEKKLRMSKQEIKDEYKKMEGDPVVKGKRRQIQRQMAMNRMMQDVPKADVVITNPTHFAVAIRYDFKTMDTPIVIAKGKEHVALKIKEIAKQHKIMTIENKPLARALFAAVEVGESVPEEMFNAVGEILAYVYYHEGRYKGMMR